MSHLSIRHASVLIAICLAAGAFTAPSCSLPNLEKPECVQARDNVKQFYSWMIGTDPLERQAHSEIFRKFISPSFAADPGDVEIDPYTLSAVAPKTFRLGKCEVLDPDKIRLQVQLLWREEPNSRQQDVNVEAVRSDDRWLITKITK